MANLLVEQLASALAQFFQRTRWDEPGLATGSPCRSLALSRALGGQAMCFSRNGFSSLLIFAATLAESKLAAAGNNSPRFRFSPAVGVRVSLVVHDHDVVVTVVGAQRKSKETIAVETERSLKINLEDYDFDGHMDFSISHVDEGMGTYEVFQIYVYSESEKKFVMLIPKCGDEFVNVVVSKRSRTLINSYVLDNRYETCEMKF